MRAVNLLPRDTEAVRSPSVLPILAAVGALVGVTIVVGMLGMKASAQADQRRADLELTEAALARIPKTAPQAAAPDVSVERSNRIAALERALSTSVPIDRLLTDLSYVVPEDVWLTGFTVTIPSDAAAAGSSPTPGAGAAPAATVTIKGAAYAQPSIARFLARLASLSSLGHARLAESARVEPQAPEAGAKKPKKTQRAVITFTVTAELGEGMRS
jgi:Tfp pilus assembly protein PilN